MEPPKLLVEGVSKVFRDGRKSLETLASIDLVVNLGEFVTVIGPSGGGKSTLFNIVAGVDQPSSGMVAIDVRPMYAPTTGNTSSHTHS